MVLSGQGLSICEVHWPTSPGELGARTHAPGHLILILSVFSFFPFFLAPTIRLPGAGKT